MIDSGHVATANRACALLYSFIKEQPQGIWLLPVNVCPDVPLTFALAGVQFQFVDINPQTLCIDIDDCKRRIKNKDSNVTGIVYVRTYGFLTDTSELFLSLKDANPEMRIIDDRCLCIPEVPVNYGNADMILYSTGHCKPIDFGGGGLAFYAQPTVYNCDVDLFYDGTDEERLYKEAYANKTTLSLIPQGWLQLGKYKNPDIYLQEISQCVNDRILQREELNMIYRESLPDSIQLKKEYQNWRFNIMVPSTIKNELLNTLFENRLFASSHYHSANRLFDTSEYMYSDRLFCQIINLFNDKYYTAEKAIRTCEIINEVYKKRIN